MMSWSTNLEDEPNRFVSWMSTVHLHNTVRRDSVCSRYGSESQVAGSRQDCMRMAELGYKYLSVVFRCSPHRVCLSRSLLGGQTEYYIHR
jgi:hypothetical protein